jgi:hexulose-6-phosphate isomerase
MERRNFIKQTLLGTGALWVSSTTGKLLAKETAMIPQEPATGFYKSIMWGTVGLSGSVLDKCKVIKAAGYKGIEPNSHMDRNEVLAAMKATGLIASSVCCSTHWGKPLSSPDATVRNEGLEGMRIAMEDAKAYGTDAVLLVPGIVNESISYDECWTRSTEAIKELLPLARKLGVKICVENVWNNFLLSPMEARTYIDQFKSPYVRFYFDCGNILVYGWPEQWIRILGDRIGRVHIKEFSKQIAEKKGKGEGFNVKLTEGNINWKRVVEELRKSYKNNWLATDQGSSKTPEELNDLSERFDKLLSL